MGGNAIKQAHGVETVRLNAHAYEEVIKYALLTGPFVKSAAIPAYKSKPDFGDADILYCGDLPENYFSSLFPINVRNGNVHSVAWRYAFKPGITSELPDSPSPTFFQVDYIKVKPEEFDFALGYFSYNDLGNLLGRVAHRMGLKFGHDGLWVVLRDGTYVVENVLVTQDFLTALAILGYGPVPELNDLEDIFRYITTSSYFSKDLFPLEHRNTKARMRDRKRATYTAFLQWVQDNNPPDGVDAMPHTSVAREDASFAVLQRVASYASDFAPRLLDARQRYIAIKQERVNFCGELVRFVTGLDGKELGEFIANFKQYIGTDLFSYWVLSSTGEERLEAIKSFYQSLIKE